MTTRGALRVAESHEEPTRFSTGGAMAVGGEHAGWPAGTTPAGTTPDRPDGADSWCPANEVERRLRAATESGDLAAVLGVLAGVSLYLPGFQEQNPGRPGERQRLLTRDRDGVPYLPVFTSPEGLHRTVEADGWRETSLAELCRSVPAGWGLAINPVTPIGVLVPPQDVPGLVPDRDELAHFEPASDVERILRDGLGALAGEALLDVLVTARVIVPTRPVEADGVPTVPVFTSAERRDEFLAGQDLDLPTVTVDLVAVLRAWPGPDVRLAVNPGSPIAFSVGGSRVPGLLRYAMELAGKRGVPGPAGAGAVANPPLEADPAGRELDPVAGRRAGAEEPPDPAASGAAGRVDADSAAETALPGPRLPEGGIAELLRGARPAAEDGG